jgi:hypothetical protein
MGLLGTPPSNEGDYLLIINIGEYMNISQIINATPSEVDDLRVKLMDSVEYNFNERECSLLYRMAGFDLLTASECKASIMLMAQKLGNISIPGENE